MSIDKEAPSLIGVGAKALVKNAQRLGLTWQMKTATVTTVGENDTATAVYDGDTNPIDMYTMVGVLVEGDRVYAIQVPPSGNYIVGIIADQTARLWATRTQLGATSTIINITVPPNVTALDIDWTLRDTLGGFAAANLLVRVNNDSTANYAYRYIEATNVAALAQIQAFGVTAGRAGTYATGGAAATRFGNGRITFPAWNDPHNGQLGYVFTSSFENAANNGWYNTGGGFYGIVGPYTLVSLIPQATSSWAVGSQVYARGFISP